MGEIKLNILVIIDQDQMHEACGCIMGPERCALPSQIGQAAFRLIQLRANRSGYKHSSSSSSRLETTASFIGPADKGMEIAEAIEGNALLYDPAMTVLVSTEEVPDASHA